VRAAIETSLTTSRRTTGIGNYVQGLVGELVKKRYQVEVWDSLGEWGLRIPGAKIPNGVLRKLFYLLWLNIAFPFILRRRGIDVAHFTNFIPPLLTFVKPCPYVITVHDVHALKYSKYNRLYRAYRSFMLSRAVRIADSIIVPSSHAKQDVCSTLKAPETKVHVVYHAVTDDFLINETDVLSFEQRKHILGVGPLSLRKNHTALIRAYASLLRRNPSFCYDLVITGDLRDKASEPLAEIIDLEGVGNRVHLVGHVDKPTLRKLYQEAVLFVYPSQYEGFGFPCLEAMASGTPVIASNVTSLPEVVGDAGILVDPNDVQAIANAMLYLIGHPNEWSRYVKLGLERARKFSWSRAADETWAVYEKAYRNASRKAG